MLPGLDLHSADPGQPLTTAGEEVDDLHRDLFGLSVRAFQQHTQVDDSYKSCCGSSWRD